MLAIAVLPSSQTRGAGSALTNHLEKRLRQRGNRILIADNTCPNPEGLVPPIIAAQKTPLPCQPHLSRMRPGDQAKHIGLPCSQ